MSWSVLRYTRGVMGTAFAQSLGSGVVAILHYASQRGCGGCGIIAAYVLVLGLRVWCCLLLYSSCTYSGIVGVGTLLLVCSWCLPSLSPGYVLELHQFS